VTNEEEHLGISSETEKKDCFANNQSNEKDLKQNKKENN
jgi:hypothetical protein